MEYKIRDWNRLNEAFGFQTSLQIPLKVIFAPLPPVLIGNPIRVYKNNLGESNRVPLFSSYKFFLRQ